MLPESYTSQLTQSCGGTERQYRGQESIARMHATTHMSQYDNPLTRFFKSCEEPTRYLTVISGSSSYVPKPNFRGQWPVKVN